ncbi:MAG: hypothetical protein ACK4YY_09920, partial [Dolichospermum sp.]
CPKYVVGANPRGCPNPRGCLKYRGRHGGATPTTSTFCLDLLRVIWKGVGTGALPLQPLH